MDKILGSRYYVFKLDQHGFLEKDRLNFSDLGYNTENEAKEEIIKFDLYGEHFILGSFYLQADYSK